jgi:hypothetical protein
MAQEQLQSQHITSIYIHRLQSKHNTHSLHKTISLNPTNPTCSKNPSPPTTSNPSISTTPLSKRTSSVRPIIPLYKSILIYPANLPAAYRRHTSSNIVKGFSVRITVVDDDCFAATAIADLGLPASLAEDMNIVLEDEFMEMYSNVSALEALEQLFDEVEIRIGEGDGKGCM